MMTDDLDNLAGRLSAAVMRQWRGLGAAPDFIDGVLAASAERDDLELLWLAVSDLFVTAARRTYTERGLLGVQLTLADIGNSPGGDGLHDVAARVVLAHMHWRDVQLDVDSRIRRSGNVMQELGLFDDRDVRLDRLIIAVIETWTTLLPTLTPDDIEDLGAGATLE